MKMSLNEDRYASIQNLIKDVNANKNILSNYVNCEDLIYLLNEMANADTRTIDGQTKRLLAYMLKCKYQPSKFSRSWVNTVQDSSEVINDICMKSKSLYNYYVTDFNKNYKSAINYAHNETRLNISAFPINCEWDKDDILNEEFISQFIDECAKNSTNLYY